MAKEVNPDSILFDAASQYEGWAFRTNATPPILKTKLYVKDAVIFGGGTGGTCHVTETDGGATVIPSLEVAADEEQGYPISRWVDGLWVETLDTGLKVMFNVGWD